MSQSYMKYLKVTNKTLYALIGYLFLIVIAFHSVIFGNKSLYPMTYTGRSTEYLTADKQLLHNIDSGGIYLDSGASDWVEIPLMNTAEQIAQDGELPTWSPYNSLGMPLIDNNNGSTLAPFSLLLYISNSEAMWNAMYLLRLLFIMTFTFLFFYELECSYYASFLGGIIFGFSGYVMGYLNIFFLHVDAFLPMLMWATLKYIRKKNIFTWGLCSLSTAFMCLGGNPQNLITCCLLSFTFFLIEIINFSNRSYISIFKEIMTYIGCYLTGILLTLGYWLSFFTLYSNCYSYHGQAGLSVKSISALLGLVFPKMVFSANFRNEMPYVGMSVILFLLIFLRFEQHSKYYKEKVFCFVFILLFILKIVGFPLLRWIGTLPILKELTFTKYNSCIYFAFTMLFTCSFTELQEKHSKQIKIYLLSLIGITLSLIVSLYQSNAKMMELLEKYLNSAQILIIVLTIILLLALLFKNINMQLGAIALAVCFELISYPIAKADVMVEYGKAFTEPPFIQALKQIQDETYDRVFCVGGTLMGNMSAIYQIENIGGISPTPEKHYWNFMNSLVLNDNPDLQVVESQSSEYYPYSRKFLNMLGAKYFIIDNYGKIDDVDLMAVYTSDRMTIYENLQAFDRAYTVHSVAYAKDEQDALRLMQDKSFNPATTAIVESSIPIGAVSEINDQDNIQIINYGSTSITLECQMKSNGLLVLSDLFYPGWCAQVNGERANILRTNDVMRGIYLEEGTYTIEFSYRPIPLYIGFFISLLTILIYVIVLVMRNKKITKERRK